MNVQPNEQARALSENPFNEKKITTLCGSVDSQLKNILNSIQNAQNRATTTLICVLERLVQRDLEQSRPASSKEPVC